MRGLGMTKGERRSLRRKLDIIQQADAHSTKTMKRTRRSTTPEPFETIWGLAALFYGVKVHVDLEAAKGGDSDESND